MGVPGITLDLSSKELSGRMWLKCLIITGSLWALNELVWGESLLKPMISNRCTRKPCIYIYIERERERCLAKYQLKGEWFDLPSCHKFSSVLLEDGLPDPEARCQQDVRLSVVWCSEGQQEKCGRSLAHPWCSSEYIRLDVLPGCSGMEGVARFSRAYRRGSCLAVSWWTYGIETTEMNVPGLFFKRQHFLDFHQIS